MSPPPSPPHPMGEEISQQGSNPQNTKLYYPRISYKELHQNLTISSGDMSQAKIFFFISPSFGGNFPTVV